MKKTVDFEDIIGQEHCKRGLEVAVAGGHNVLLIGPEDAQIKDLIRCIDTITPEEYAGIEAYSTTPCPCGNFTHPKKECRCTPRQIQRHLERVSKRMAKCDVDIQLEVPVLSVGCTSNKRLGEPSHIVRDRVHKAGREILARSAHATFDLEHLLDKEADELLKLAILELGVSAKAHYKIVKVSYTIAVLDGKDIIECHHLSEAISYRSLDRNLWG